MNESSYWLFRCENQLLVNIGKTGIGQPGVDQTGENIFPFGRAADFGSPGDVLLVGEFQGRACYAADLDKLPENIAGELMPVRSFLSLAGAEAIALAGRATQLLDWRKNHRYCGRCGASTVVKTGQFAMLCPACDLVAYPRIAPAVMVLISRGDELLLARSHRFRPGVFSALAGFVEAGETLEQCASREVLEEVGISIANLRYFGSQSWPFPNSLMVAFFAGYAGGDIKPDPSEIEDARWFPGNALPALPEPVSIARQLIDAACRQQ